MRKPRRAPLDTKIASHMALPLSAVAHLLPTLASPLAHLSSPSIPDKAALLTFPNRNRFRASEDSGQTTSCCLSRIITSFMCSPREIARDHSPLFSPPPHSLFICSLHYQLRSLPPSSSKYLVTLCIGSILVVLLIILTPSE